MSSLGLALGLDALAQGALGKGLKLWLGRSLVSAPFLIWLAGIIC